MSNKPLYAMHACHLHSSLPYLLEPFGYIYFTSVVVKVSFKNLTVVKYLKMLDTSVIFG